MVPMEVGDIEGGIVPQDRSIWQSLISGASWLILGMLVGHKHYTNDIQMRQYSCPEVILGSRLFNFSWSVVLCLYLLWARYQWCPFWSSLWGELYCRDEVCTSIFLQWAFYVVGFINTVKSLSYVTPEDDFMNYQKFIENSEVVEGLTVCEAPFSMMP